MPTGDVLLPTCEAPTALLTILIALQHSQTIDRVHGQVDRATSVQGLEALRRMEPADRNKRGQFFQAVEIIPRD
jgi:hypothetical protein